MQEKTIYIIIAVVVFFLLILWKKRKERQMGQNLNDLVEAEDWEGVSRFYFNQLVIWGVLAFAMTVIVIAAFIDGSKRYSLIAVDAIIIWRTIRLARNYHISRKNEHWQQNIG